MWGTQHTHQPRPCFYRSTNSSMSVTCTRVTLPSPPELYSCFSDEHILTHPSACETALRDIVYYRYICNTFQLNTAPAYMLLSDKSIVHAHPHHYLAVFYTLHLQFSTKCTIYAPVVSIPRHFKGLILEVCENLMPQCRALQRLNPLNMMLVRAHATIR